MSITLYSKNSCGQCDQAKMLLSMKSIDYTLKMLDIDYTLEEIQTLVPSAKSFPVIFKDDTYLGGLNELRQYISKQL